MLLAGFVVAQVTRLQRVLQVLQRDARVILPGGIQAGGGFQQVERLARVAVGVFGQKVLRVLLHRDAQFLRAALEDAPDMLHRQRFQDKDLRSREQRGDDLEAGVFRRRADQHDCAVFDIRQQKVLLRLVEAVNLIQKQHHPSPLLVVGFVEQPRLCNGFVPRFFDHFAHFGLARADRRECVKWALGVLRQQPCQRRFTDSRRPPEDHRVQLVVLHRQIKRFAGADQMLLPDKFIKRLWANAVCQRLGGAVRHGMSCCANDCRIVSQTRRRWSMERETCVLGAGVKAAQQSVRGRSAAPSMSGRQWWRKAAPRQNPAPTDDPGILLPAR